MSSLCAKRMLFTLSSLLPSASHIKTVPTLAYLQRLKPSSEKFSTITRLKMPDNLTSSEVNSRTDPSVSKQYDTKTPKVQQITEFFKAVDEHKVGLLNTYRSGVGPVGRSMAVAKRVGPDLLFLANNHSQKFSDLNDNPECQVTFQDSKNQDWISISGTATSISNSDPRIKELHSTSIKAWFGDLGDGKHDGSANDPRLSLIEVKAKYITYWLHTVGALGFLKEVGVASVTGKVADTGVLRELGEQDIEKARQLESQ